MQYFTLKEMSASLVAERQGIVNTPPDEAVLRLKLLIANLLNPLRERWGEPIRVTSGYRCAALNRVVGGVANSQHLRGEAADITAGDRTKNRRLLRMILESGLDFDQLIDESDCLWLHISWSQAGNRKQFLTVK